MHNGKQRLLLFALDLSDLCSLCQLNNGKIAANVNVSEQEN